MSMIFFYFLKIIFEISISKRSKKYKSHSILAKKNKFKFGQTQVQPQNQTGSCRATNEEFIFPLSHTLIAFCSFYFIFLKPMCYVGMFGS